MIGSNSDSNDRFADIKDDTTFRILSHEVRRSILNTIFFKGFISYKEIAEDYGLSTGSIYNHLKILSPLLEQDADKKYTLNERGKRVCEWFFESTATTVELRRLDTFTQLTSPVLYFVEDHPRLSLAVAILLLLSGSYIAAQFDILVVGTTFGISNLTQSSLQLFAGNIALTLTIVGLVAWLSGALSPYNWTKTPVVATYLLSTLVPSLLFLIFYLYGIIVGSSIQLTETWTLVITTVSQFVFLMLASTGSSYYLSKKIEKSALITLGILYFQSVFAGFLLI